MPADFVTVLDRVVAVEGWLSDEQARRLYDRAAALTADATIVEIGSFRGRSTIVLASAAAAGISVIAIDPHAGGDRGPREITPDRELGDTDHAAFVENLARAGVIERVDHVRSESDAAHPRVSGPVDLLYVDGAHRLGPARRDLLGWGERVAPGGTMMVHDSFSSVGVTLALSTTTFFGPRWRYVGRTGSLAEYRRERMGLRSRAVNAGRQLAQLPWFARNVIVKVLLVARLRPLTRLLGHRGGDWPY